MVATIHDSLDEEESQFKPNLGLVINFNCVAYYMSHLSSKDEHNQIVKKRIAEEIGMKIGNSFTKIEIDSMLLCTLCCMHNYHVRSYSKIF